VQKLYVSIIERNNVVISKLEAATPSDIFCV